MPSWDNKTRAPLREPRQYKTFTIACPPDEIQRLRVKLRKTNLRHQEITENPGALTWQTLTMLLDAYCEGKLDEALPAHTMFRG